MSQFNWNDLFGAAYQQQAAHNVFSQFFNAQTGQTANQQYYGGIPQQTAQDHRPDMAEAGVICRVASQHGFRLKEGRNAVGLVQFTWRGPDGNTLHCEGSRDRGQALLNACYALV